MHGHITLEPRRLLSKEQDGDSLSVGDHSSKDEFQDKMSYLLIGSAVVVLSVVVFTLMKKLSGQPHLNLTIDKHKPKVVNTVDVEDLADATAFCRCWKSSKFPYCDGTHNKHNKVTGDNVGPLLLNRKS